MIDWNLDQNKRVAVAFSNDIAADGDYIFRSLSRHNAAILAGDGGNEVWVPVENIKSIAVAQKECVTCGEPVNVFRASGRCADCERRSAIGEQPPHEVCTLCDAGNVAHYSPGLKLWGCSYCRAARNDTSSTVDSSARVRPICLTDDLNSRRHSWIDMRGKWVCEVCGFKSYDKPAFA